MDCFVASLLAMTEERVEHPTLVILHAVALFRRTRSLGILVAVQGGSCAGKSSATSAQQ
jgi:hypothetical protein